MSTSAIDKNFIEVDGYYINPKMIVCFKEVTVNCKPHVYVEFKHENSRYFDISLESFLRKLDNER